MSTDVDEQVIQNTQKMLEKYIKKPILTGKLLRKPPFRFLHDIVNNVIRETGFLKGLYSERELVSENVKSKDEKIAFLNKLIDAVKEITALELAVRPSKVVAGFEPTETNLLLQAIGTALDQKLDSSKYVSELKNKKKPKTVEDKDGKKKGKESSKLATKQTDKTKIPVSKKSMEKIKPKSKKETASTEKDSKMKMQTKKNKEEKVTSVEQNEVVTEEIGLAQSNDMPKPPVDVISDKELDQHKLVFDTSNDALKENVTENTIVKKNDIAEFPLVNKVSDPIKSAKRTKSSLKILKTEPEHEEAPKIMEPLPISPSLEQESPSVPTITVDTSLNAARPRSSLRPPSVRPSSARPGAPRLRNEVLLVEDEIVPLGKVNVILENFSNKDLDDEETITIQTTPELEYQAQPLQLPSDKGHLVEQILEQINSDVEHAKSTVNIEWEEDALQDRNATNKDIEQLRYAIQTLTRVANPLGKLVNYLHEDIEAMQSELDMWNDSLKQITIEIKTQRRICDEANKPLQIKLEEIESNIIKYEQQIITAYGNILRNEDRIKGFLI